MDRRQFISVSVPSAMLCTSMCGIANEEAGDNSSLQTFLKEQFALRPRLCVPGRTLLYRLPSRMKDQRITYEPIESNKILEDISLKMRGEDWHLILNTSDRAPKGMSELSLNARIEGESKTESAINVDLKIEFTDYYDKCYSELIVGVDEGGFRDKHGLVVSRRNDGSPKDKGNSVLYTGIGGAACALGGDKDATLDLLDVLLNVTWAGGHPIRHPEVLDFIMEDGRLQRLGHRPMPRDDFVGVLVFADSIQREFEDEKVRSRARDLLSKHLNYLVEHQWRFQSRYAAESQIPIDGGEALYNEDGEKHMKLGAEAFTPTPLERLTLLRLCDLFGLNTKGIQLPESLASTLTQTAGDYLIEVYDQLCGPVLDAIPPKLNVSFRLSARGPKIELPLSTSMPSHKDLRSVLKEKVREVVLNSNRVLQSTELITVLVNECRKRAPGSDFVKYVLPTYLERCLPPFPQRAAEELRALVVELEGAKQQKKEDDLHLTVWTAYLICANRPELRRLTALYLNDFYSATKADDNLVSSTLVGDSKKRNRFISLFEQDESYSKMDYAWNRSRESQLEDRQRAWHEVEPEWPRLDYLVIKHLEQPSNIGIDFKQSLATVATEQMSKLFKHCPTCSASGVISEKLKKKCPTCAGAKTVREKCRKCNGVGDITKVLMKCALCKGSGKIKKTVAVRVRGRTVGKKTVNVNCPHNAGKIAERVAKTCPVCDGAKKITKDCPKCEAVGLVMHVTKKTCPKCSGKRAVRK